MSPVLSLRGVVKAFGGVRAVDNVSMDLAGGGVNLLIGSNGSGKSTLVNLVSGLHRADRGRILFRGADVGRMPADRRFRMGMVRTFQTPRLFANLSVLENLMVSRIHPGESFRRGLLRRGWAGEEASRKERALSILGRLEMEGSKDNLAYDLSGGQIKMLELGKVLMSDSGLVLLDEPIAGINPRRAHFIFENIAGVSGVTFLIVEHRLDIAMQYAGRVYVMDRGRLIAEGDPGAVLEDRDVIESYLG